VSCRLPPRAGDRHCGRPTKRSNAPRSKPNKRSRRNVRPASSAGTSPCRWRGKPRSFTGKSFSGQAKRTRGSSSRCSPIMARSCSGPTSARHRLATRCSKRCSMRRRSTPLRCRRCSMNMRAPRRWPTSACRSRSPAKASSNDGFNPMASNCSRPRTCADRSWQKAWPPRASPTKQNARSWLPRNCATSKSCARCKSVTKRSSAKPIRQGPPSSSDFATPTPRPSKRWSRIEQPTSSPRSRLATLTCSSCEPFTQAS